MSKIKINHIQSEHGMRLTPYGFGDVEIVSKSQDNDATLEIVNTTTNKGVTIKAPPKDLTYMLSFPIFDPVANKFLKVTGSVYGNSQLGYDDIPFPTTEAANADTYLTGTIPSARLSNFNGSTGAGLKLVNSFAINDGEALTQVEFDLDQNKYYRIVAKNINYSAQDYPIAFFVNTVINLDF